MAYASQTARNAASRCCRAIANRLGEVMEEKHHRIDRPRSSRNFKAEFIDFLNRRFADYAEFEFSRMTGRPGFPLGTAFLGHSLPPRPFFHPSLAFIFVCFTG